MWERGRSRPSPRTEEANSESRSAAGIGKTRRWLGEIPKWLDLSCTILTVAAIAVWTGTAGAALTPAQKCEKTKNKAAAKYGQCIATQRGKEIGGKIPEYAECATKLTDTFTKAEQNAVDAGSACPTTGDAAAVFSRVDGVYDPSNASPKWFSNTRFADNGDGTADSFDKRTPDYVRGVRGGL